MLPFILGTVAVGGISYLVYNWLQPIHPHPLQGQTPPNNKGGVPVFTNPATGQPVDLNKAPTITPPGPKETTSPPAIVVTTTPAGNQVTGVATTEQLKGASNTFANAQHLLDYLKANGADGTPAFRALVTAFQQSIKTENKLVPYADGVNINGIFDLPTATVFAVFIGDPYAPEDVPAKLDPAFVANKDMPGSAAHSSTILFTYLRKYGNDKSQREMGIVKQFQNDVNTDWKYPGPAGKPPVVTTKRITTPLKVDGKYGTQSQAALAVYGMAPKP